jgi:DNA-binding transcriptional MocR family regulator
MLRGQDVLVLLWLAQSGQPPRSVRALATETHLSLASVQRALQRLETAGLYDARRRSVSAAHAEEFLLHAVRYAVPAVRGGETRGVPTAWAAAPLNRELASTSELPPVWPDPDGKVRGLVFQPLHPVVLDLAKEDESFYETLALVDALRGPADVRTIRLAREILSGRLRATITP